jgi:hypothetical protein
MSRDTKLFLWASVLCLTAFVFYFGYTEYSATNGVLESYYSLNVFAIGAGVGVVAIARALRRRPRGEERHPSWVLPVFVVLVVLGSLHVVRGSGVLPSITGCYSETSTLNFCTPTTIDAY